MTNIIRLDTGQEVPFETLNNLVELERFSRMLTVHRKLELDKLKTEAALLKKLLAVKQAELTRCEPCASGTKVKKKTTELFELMKESIKTLPVKFSRRDVFRVVIAQLPIGHAFKVNAYALQAQFDKLKKGGLIARTGNKGATLLFSVPPVVTALLLMVFLLAGCSPARFDAPTVPKAVLTSERPVMSPVLVNRAFDIDMLTNSTYKTLTWTPAQSLLWEVDVITNLGGSWRVVQYSTNAYFPVINNYNRLSLFRVVGHSLASVTLAWDASLYTNPIVAGVNIYYGGVSKTYTNKTSVGPVASLTLSNFSSGFTYYFAATSYSAAGCESALSSEISYLVLFNTNNIIRPVLKLQ